MQHRQPAVQNRIASDMDAWKRIEDKLANRYGRRIVYDRDFLRAKRDVFKHIRDKYKPKRLNLFEKAELRVLRGQRRQLIRQMYPNPYVRLIRNLLVFAANVVMTGGKLLWQAVAPAPQPGLTPVRSTVAQKKAQEVKPVKQTQRASKKITPAKAVVRKMPMKARVRMPATPGKGIKQ